MSGNYRDCSSSSEIRESGLLNELVFVILVQFMNWDISFVARLACVCRKLRANANRVVWNKLCISRAPLMITTFGDVPIAVGPRPISIEWQTIAKALFYCCGCKSTQHFQVRLTVAGHLVEKSRFSKTSGKSFLIKQCRDDVLYVSDPCDHTSEFEDVAIFRGVFREFPTSKTKALLIRQNAQLDENVRCPYCRCRVWSMTEARLVPKSASLRLGCDDGMLEYFVCVNGHMHGGGWSVPFSSDEGGGNASHIDSMDE